MKKNLSWFRCYTLLEIISILILCILSLSLCILLYIKGTYPLCLGILIITTLFAHLPLILRVSKKNNNLTCNNNDLPNTHNLTKIILVHILEVVAIFFLILIIHNLFINYESYNEEPIEQETLIREEKTKEELEKEWEANYQRKVASGAYYNSEDATPTYSNKKVVPKKTDRRIIGRWKVEVQGVNQSMSMVIYEEEGKFYADGFMGKESLRKSGNKYYVIDSRHKEYYIISNGKLKFYDQDGYIPNITAY